MKKFIVALLLIAASACAQLTNFYVGVSEYIGVQQTPVAWTAGAAFSPTNSYPTNISFWLDPALCETNGGTFFFYDRVGMLPSITNTAGAAFPTYNASGLNGLPTLTFDGTDDRLRSGATYVTNTGTRCWTMLMRWESSDNTERRLTMFNDFYGIIRATVTSNYRYLFGGETADPWTNQLNNWLVYTFVHDGGTHMAIYTNFNKVNVGTGSGATTQPNQNTSMCLGGHFTTGNNAAFSIGDWIGLTNLDFSYLSPTITNSVISNCVWYLTNKYDLSP